MEISEVYNSANLSELSANVTKFLASRGYPGWKLYLSPTKIGFDTLGLCVYNSKTIFILHSLMTKAPKLGMDTVIHEMAHVLTPKDFNHGPEWIAAAKELGLEDPQQLTDIHLPDMPIEVQRCLYTHRMGLSLPGKEIEWLDEYTNHPKSTLRRYLVDRPETLNCLHWYKI